ncbi:HET-domain-containing protein [Xylariaceae sp. FL1272]|nr:HET-domain-containing protein [Xylariaceae sp. FL1272]
MHLIDVNTLRLRKFVNESNAVGTYGILSHRWLAIEDEVTFQDIESLDSNIASQRKGYWKITETCKLAKRQGLSYCWIDTCCIDKLSSAELQEAVNSMYRWYKNAAVCFVHLRNDDTDHIATDNDGNDDDPANRRSNFVQYRDNEWFTRGWTLQELIAPRNVLFYDYSWLYIGNKTDLADELCTITQIDAALLKGSKKVTDYSIAQRMSWASHRKTERPEDRSYSLFGIFGVYMTMLYGEGGKNAFLRLQEEIIKTSHDHSIFAWTGGIAEPCGMLATNLEAFSESGTVKTVERRFGSRTRTPFSMTNIGLHITLRLLPVTFGIYCARLACTAPGVETDDFSLLEASWIFLHKTETEGHYMRVSREQKDFWLMDSEPSARWMYEWRARYVSFYVPQQRGADILMKSVTGFQADIIGDRRVTSQFYPVTSLHEACKTDVPANSAGVEAVRLSWDFDFNPTVFLGESSLNPADLRWIKEGRLQVNEHNGRFAASEPLYLDKYKAWNAGDLQSGVYYKNECPGLWALKGSRSTGLYADLDSTGMHVRIFMEKRGDSLIWRFEIDLAVSKVKAPQCGEDETFPDLTSAKEKKRIFFLGRKKRQPVTMN